MVGNQHALVRLACGLLNALKDPPQGGVADLLVEDRMGRKVVLEHAIEKRRDGRPHVRADRHLRLEGAFQSDEPFVRGHRGPNASVVIRPNAIRGLETCADPLLQSALLASQDCPGLLPVAGGEMTGGLIETVSCSGEQVVDAHERAEILEGAFAEIGGLPDDAAGSAVVAEIAGVREVSRREAGP